MVKVATTYEKYHSFHLTFLLPLESCGLFIDQFVLKDVQLLPLSVLQVDPLMKFLGTEVNFNFDYPDNYR